MRAALFTVLVACGSPSARAIDAATSDGRSGDADVVDGKVIDGQIVDGQVVDGPLLDGQSVDGAIADGAVPDAQVVDAVVADAHVPDAPVPDAMIVVDAATGTTVHITGVVDQLPGAHVTDLGDGSVAIAGTGGAFAFDVPGGTHLLMRATNGDATHLPMLRGVDAQAGMRTRHFNLVTTAQLSAMSALGVAFDPSKAIVQIDFRHAQGSGYGVKLTQAGGEVVPGFGVADSGGDYVLATTTQSAFTTTLLLANLPPGATRFQPLVPTSATLPCQHRDADPLPLEAGSVTWVDFECGTDTAP